MRVGAVLEIWRYPVKSMGGQRLGGAHVGTRGVWGDRGWAVRDEVTGEILNAKRHPVLMHCSALYREEPRPDSVPHAEITLPDGSAFSSDSPAAPQRLSDLMRRRVVLTPPALATDLTSFRRHEAGSALMARMWAFRPARRLLQRALFSGRMGEELRKTFGLEPGEPAPDLSGLPGSVWEFYTPPGTYFDVAPINVVTTSTLQRMSQLNPTADWDVRRFRPNVLLEAEGTGAVERDWVGQALRVGGAVIKGDLPTVRCAMPMHAQPGLPRDPSVLRTIVREASQCLGLYASVVEAGSVATGDPVELVRR